MSENSSITNELGFDEFEWLEKAADEEGFLVVPTAGPTDSENDHRIEEFAWFADELGLELPQKVGSGATCEVFRANSTGDLSDAVAIKLFRQTVPDDASRTRFHREVEVLKVLQHENIARIRSSGITPFGHPYIVLDYVDGQRIDQHCQSIGHQHKQLARMVIKICEGVQYAHGHGVVHRDLTPSNILVNSDGKPVITDFGLSKFFLGDHETASARTRTGDIVGTLNYMSPEQLFSTDEYQVSYQTDIFGIGAVLYRLLTGVPPFRFDSVVQAATGYFKKLPTKLAGGENIPVGLEAICLRCLDPNPDKRYPSASAIAGDLQRFVEGKPVMAKRPGWRHRAGRFAKQYPLITWGVPLIFCMILVLGSVIFGLWRSAENNLNLARELVLALEADVKRYEEDPSKLLVRHAELQQISEAYDKLLRNTRDDALLQKSAKVDFKLAEIKQHQGDLAGQNKYWQRAADKFRILLESDVENEDSRFDLFHSLVRLNQLDAALDEIEILTTNYPDNPDYQDALCYCLLQIGCKELELYRGEEAKARFDRAFLVADKLPNDVSPSRYVRKKAGVRFNLAKHAVFNGDLVQGDLLLDEARQLYLSVDPLALATHGESSEYLRCLKFQLAIAAYNNDDRKVKSLVELARSFSELAIQRYEACIHLRQIYCDFLRDYAAFCETSGHGNANDVIAQWGKVLSDWARTFEPTRAYLRRRLQFELYPGNQTVNDKEIDATVAGLLAVDPAMSGFHLARAYFVLNRSVIAKRTLRTALDSNAGLVQPRKYLRLIEASESTEGIVPEVALTEKARLQILATIESFAETLVGEMATADLARNQKTR